jgi:hypothetical protein
LHGTRLVHRDAHRHALRVIAVKLEAYIVRPRAARCGQRARRGTAILAEARLGPRGNRCHMHRRARGAATTEARHVEVGQAETRHAGKRATARKSSATQYQCDRATHHNCPPRPVAQDDYKIGDLRLQFGHWVRTTPRPVAGHPARDSFSCRVFIPPTRRHEASAKSASATPVNRHAHCDRSRGGDVARVASAVKSPLVSVVTIR